MLFVILVACLAAPLYASLVSGTNPFHSNLSGKIMVDGKRMAVMQQSTQGRRLGVTPIGPTWRGAYLLGADAQGRDVAARLLYGGRNSLMIAGSATALCLILAAIMGVTAGFLGGGVDMVLSRILDVLWAFPVYLLAISLSIVLISEPIVIGSITIGSGSLILPIVIIGLVYVPYVARPLRGQVLALRNSEFVLASVGLGIPTSRILMRDILPNVSTTSDRLYPTHDGAEYHHGVGAFLPVGGRAAARCKLGHHHPGRAGAPVHTSRRIPGARLCDRDHRAGAQSTGRRRARCTRSAHAGLRR